MKAQGTSARIVFATAILFGTCACMLLASSNSYGALITIGYYSSQYQYTLLPDINSDDYKTDVNPDGSYHWEGSYDVPGYLSMNWKLDFDGDPTVSGFVGLTNNSAFTNTFTVIVSQPISPALPTSVMNGSTAWTVTDGNENGATLDATTGVGSNALYNAQVDGSTVRQLYVLGNAPLPLVAGVDDSASINTSFSGEITPVAANSTIGIFHHFSLTSGDSASATSVFRIVATNAPEPSSFVLAAMGLAGVGLAYRRRR